MQFIENKQLFSIDIICTFVARAFKTMLLLYIHVKSRTSDKSNQLGEEILIKLIVADMDGTLLDSQKRLPKDFPALMEALTEKGIAFVPASGRSYLTLSSTFEPYKSRMGFICDNGCSTYFKEKLINIAEIDHSEIHRILDLVFEVGDLYPGLCGMNGFYIQHRAESFLDLVNRYFKGPVLLDDIYSAIEMDTFCKISCSDQIEAETHGMDGLAPLMDKYDLLPSGESWIDVVQKGSNKGVALTKFMEKLGISRDETMVFADYVNDMSMMDKCTHTYAMKNAHPDIKAAARYVTEKTNDENGVVYTISKVLGLNL